jgi:hypothetical protein
MAFALLAEVRKVDDRLYDNHIAFVGLWSKEQLKPIVEGLGLSTKKTSYAIANLARTLVLEGSFHYSRRCEWYADRYKTNGDQFHSYRLTPKAADWLKDNGYAEHTLGYHVPNQPGAGRQSTLYATQKLLDAIGHLVDRLEPRAFAPRPEVIILRDADGKLKHYQTTPETQTMSADVWKFNDHFAMRELHRKGRLVPIPFFQRIFNRTFDRGGRLYCRGESYQQLSGKERSEITEVIGGITHAFVEIDFRAHHITLAYALAGEPMPEGDPYSIPGYECDEGRDLIKLAGLISFNAENKKSAVGALAHETGCTREEAQAAIEAFQAKHPGINEYFFSDAGATLMRMDSDITVAIMKRVLAALGRCPLPVHDSYLVPVCDYHELVKAMTEVSAEFFLKSSLKVSGDYSSSYPLPSYGDTFSPDPSLLDRYRQKTSPKNVSRQDYEQWIAANLPDDPRPSVEDPDRYLAWFRRNATFLYEKGRYPCKNWRTKAVDYYTWANRDQLNATLIANGLTLDKLHDRKARRTAAGKKSARTRKANRANKALSVRVFGYSMPVDELKRGLLDVGPLELYGEMRQTYWELTGNVPSSEWDPREVWQWESAEEIYEYDV